MELTVYINLDTGFFLARTDDEISFPFSADIDISCEFKYYDLSQLCKVWGPLSGGTRGRLKVGLFFKNGEFLPLEIDSESYIDLKATVKLNRMIDEPESEHYSLRKLTKVECDRVLNHRFEKSLKNSIKFSIASISVMFIALIFQPFLIKFAMAFLITTITIAIIYFFKKTRFRTTVEALYYKSLEEN
jgi:hypothetical protein